MDTRRFETLKKRAKEKLQENQQARNLDGTTLTREEINNAFHDLQVYQVELEIQNEELINTQQQLMELSEQFRNLYNAAPIGYLTISLDGLITQCNETFLNLLGLTYGDVLNRSIRNWIAHRDSNTYYDFRKKLITTGQQQFFKLHIQRKNNTEIYAKISLKLDDLADRKKILMIIQDETEMLNIQDAYENLVENSAQGLWLFQEEELVFANNRACEILGCDSREYVGKTVNDMFLMIDSNDWQRFVQVFDDSAGYTKKIEPKTLRFHNKNSGTHLWLEFFISRSKYRGNDAIQLAFTDVTDKVVADEKIRKSEHLFKTTSNLASDSIYLISLPERKLHLLASGQEYKKYDYDFSKMDLETFFNSIDSEFRQKVILKHQNLIDEGEDFEETYPMHLPNGENIYIHDRATVLEWENEKPKTLIGVTSDMTEIIEKEKQLTELNATKDKFFSIIAHDLKNPFNSMIGFAEMLNEDYDNMNDEERKNIIGILGTTANNGFKLLENLLNWSRLQTKRIEYTPQVFNLFDLASDMIDFMNSWANQKQISLKLQIAEETTVYADQNITETILRNLISNAIKFTPAQGNVRIEASAGKNSNSIRIIVRDTGNGIEKEKLENIFSIASMETAPGTAGERGTGLGLFLCRDFVKMEGGEIWIESEVGKGTAVYFTLKINPEK